MPDHDDIARWLASEQREDEAVAAVAFARLAERLPRLAPGPAFAARLDADIRRYCSRRQRAVRWARATAALLILFAGTAIAVVSLGPIGGALVEAGATLLPDAAVRLASLGRAALDWWAFVARTSEGVRIVFGQPPVVATLLALEALGLLAAVALRRVLERHPAAPLSTEARV
jgi:hypothetical protein